MAKNDKDMVLILQNQVKKLQYELYNIMVTGEIPKITHPIKRRKSFKNFLKENKNARDIFTGTKKNYKVDFKKLERLVKTYNLDQSLQLTGMRYIRIATYIDNVEQLLHDIVNCSDDYYELPNGFKVKPSSLRYQVFNQNLTCSKCGIKGKFLALERCLSDKGGDEGDREGQGFHLNLYALDEIGREVLMTKDHIIPKSKGGPDDLSNLQTMCVNCNIEKGDKEELS